MGSLLYVPLHQASQERTLGLFKEVGLDMQHLNRYPHEFSGGQRQRLNIARAIASNPRVVICDEPVSALDVSVQAQIVNLLKKIQRERKLASIFISHEINVVRYISDRIVVMYLGHIVEEAPKDELIHHPKHPYTKSLLASVPNMNPRERKRHVALEGEIPSPMDPPSGCVFHTRCPYATDRCRKEMPELREVSASQKVRCHRVVQQV
jgi:oligopeptide/dipeptide ABC transporter ATP-binding protein